MSQSATTPSQKSCHNNHVTKKLHGNGDKKTLREYKYQHQQKSSVIKPHNESEINAISSSRRKPGAEPAKANPISASKATARAKAKAKAANK